MPTKIRLQRKGKKGKAFFHIVIADGRAPRDGKYIERIGTYNPITQPADINLNFDRALYWVQTGAQPTDTVRNILSYTGVLYKHHLLKGVSKGALTEEQAEAKFDGWMKEKMEKISGKVNDLESAERAAQKSRLDAEKKINEDRAEAIAKKRAAELKALEPEVKEEEAVADSEETPETPVAEEATPETPVEEKKEEAAPAEQKKEEAPAQKTEEPKAEEPKAEEPKAEEPKAEETKAEESKAEEPKAEEKPVEEAKKEPKAEVKEEEKPAEEKSEEKKAE